MLINFFYTLRAAKLKVSVKEYLTLLEALRQGVLDDEGGPSVDKFYYLARAALVDMRSMDVRTISCRLKS